MEKPAAVLFIAALMFAACLTSAWPQDLVELYAVEQGQEQGSGVELHRPDGTAIYVNPAAIAFVREPLPGEIGNAIITFSSGAKQATQESVDEIIVKIEQDRPEGNR